MSKQNKTKAILETLHDIHACEVEDNIQTIPQLAAIERQAMGWIRIVLFGLFRFAWAFFVFLFLLVILFLWLNFSVQLIYQFLAALFPGKETQIFILMILGSSWVIYRAIGWRLILADHFLWSKVNLEEQPFNLLLTVYKRIVQLMMAVFIGSFLLYSLLPYVVVILTIIERLQSVFTNWNESRAYLHSFWQPILGIIIISFILIFLLRKSPREKLIEQNLKVIGLLGLVFITESFVFRLEPSWLYLSEIWPFTQWNEITVNDPLTMWQFGYQIVVLLTAKFWILTAELMNGNWLFSTADFIGLAMVYPMGLVLFMSKAFKWPYVVFYNALLWIVLRCKLRWIVYRALRKHKKRNHQQIKGDSWATVCQEHLIRYTSSTERLSYMRRFVYYHCPQCMQDKNVYNGVECIAIKLDADMEGHCFQTGPTLYLNGLEWVNHSQDRKRPVFDVIIIGKTRKLDIDEFITTYLNKEPSTYSREIKQIGGQVLTEIELDLSEKRYLEDHLAQLSLNYNPDINPNACTQNIRLRDSVQEKKKYFFTVAQRIIRLTLIILIMLAIIAILYYLSTLFLV